MSAAVDHTPKRKGFHTRTLNLLRSKRAQLAIFGQAPAGEYWRPVTRGDCENVPRPCPYVACKFNLYCDVTQAGNIKFNFPDLEPHEMGVSCALDVADGGEQTLNEVSSVMNITRERVRQLEWRLLDRLAPQLKRLKEEF